jgi:catechol 2,3-dioxygenase-like lactoylglutathione lyase family enzyme
MTPKIDAITLGVKDLAQARRFFEHGFGGAISEEPQALVVSLGPNASRLVLRPWETAASEAGVEENTSGFRAFTLSLILTTPGDVDRILERAARRGGRVSKPAKASFWGYSAYVTDPSGYLWKIASAKRRRLISRKEPSMNNGHVIKPQEAPITIGVADMKRAKEFYRDGLGMPIKKSFGNKFALFGGEDGTSDLGMYKREALADDAEVNPEGSGFRGFSITHVVDSAERVDALLASAVRAGGEVVKSPTVTANGRYGGYFADLDGNLWQISNHE